MLSKESRAYLLHIVPMKVVVKWDMHVVAYGPDTSRFHRELDVEMPFVVRLLGFTIGTPFFIK